MQYSAYAHSQCIDRDPQSRGRPNFSANLRCSILASGPHDSPRLSYSLCRNDFAASLLFFSLKLPRHSRFAVRGIDIRRMSFRLHREEILSCVAGDARD